MSALLPADEEKAIHEALQRDRGFWPALIKDPKAAYKAKFGKELLPGQEILVEQEGPNRVTFVSPATGLRLPVEYNATGELSDEQLDAVAGGLTMAPAPIVSIPIAAAPPIPVSNNILPTGYEK